ncbi:MAG: TetR/AcrR family transcriptional regulator [Hyphomonadaceae bacterium]|nr:TetR/AcrR family transcriptional regulator [Hyphomonadaceae bacterium]
MTRQAILDAAKKLLWLQGFEGMSPRDVMDESGAGQGSLYHHFRSKKDLAAAALDDIEGELTEKARNAFGSGRAPLLRIRTYLMQARDGLKGCRLGRLANERAVLDDGELRARLDRYFRTVIGLLADALAEARRDGALPKRINVDDLATLLLASVQGGFVLSRATQDAAAVTRATRGAWALLSGLAAEVKK